MSIQPFRMAVIGLVIVALGTCASRAQNAAPPEKGEPAPAGPGADPGAAQQAVAPLPELPSPPPIPEVKLVPNLRTTPVRRGFPGYNVQMVDASLLPRDKEGIWVLDFAFKPIRIVTVEVAGKRRYIHYLYYRVINHSGKPRMFVPQFILVTDTLQRKEDTVLPEAVKIVHAREDPTVPLLGAVNIMGMLSPSTKEGIDDAVYGVAVWEGVDPKADHLSVFVRGLSDGQQSIKPPDENGKPTTRYKTLRIDFIRRGDERNINEKEIQLLEPPYEWIYW